MEVDLYPPGPLHLKLLVHVYKLDARCICIWSLLLVIGQSHAVEVYFQLLQLTAQFRLVV
jgi:hypothetical protein